MADKRFNTERTKILETIHGDFWDRFQDRNTMDTKTSSRLTPVTADKADPEVKQMYQQIEMKMTMLPNIFKNMGNSPAMLKAYLALSEAAQGTSLSPQLQEKIALTVGQANSCNYCLAAHSLIARNLGIELEDIMNARQGVASDPKEKAILYFAKQIVEKRGNVSDQDVRDLKAHNVNDKELVEIILLVNLNMLTNYFNHITGTEVDFPAAPALKTGI